MRLDDEMLGAYLDGRLTTAEREALEQALRELPEVVRRLEELREADLLLRSAYPMPPTAAYDPIASMIRNRAPRRPLRAAGAALAVAMAAGAAGLLLFPAGAHAPPLEAAGMLAQALETQASGTRNPVEVLATLEAADGAYCRQFTMSAGPKGGEGLACRDQEKWRMVAWVENEAKTEGYHPAGADNVIDLQMERLGTGGALSPEEEAALLRSHWRPD